MRAMVGAESNKEPNSDSTRRGLNWTADVGRDLQDAVDRIFENAQGLKGLRFSFTIADPGLEGCPLIGCSEGFGTLCGYEMNEIVGRNCRFLVDPVPGEKIDQNVRRIARDYCNAVAAGTEYHVPESLRRPWMPKARAADDGVFCLQMNARKCGTLFRNMFYMKAMELDDQNYIIGLQTEVPQGQDSLPLYHKACRILDANMAQVERVLASAFWCQTSMRRQDDEDVDDGFTPLDPPVLTNRWTKAQSNQLQSVVDKVFNVAGEDLKGLRFSVTLADPLLPDCPLIACSSAFEDLCGWELEDIIGRNCRFLINPVPEDLINKKVRKLARSFCQAVQSGNDFRVDAADLEDWMPKARVHDDGVFCAQVNARKDGQLFENMFYIRKVELDEKPYIIGLQTPLPVNSLMNRGPDSPEGYGKACHRAARLLDANMGEVESCLARLFWYASPMRRQDAAEDPQVKQPKEQGGSPGRDQPWQLFCCSAAAVMPHESDPSQISCIHSDADFGQEERALQKRGT